MLFRHLDSDPATHINADPDPETLNCVQLTKSFRSEDVDLIYRKSSAHQLETPPDLELFLITLDRSQRFTHSSSRPFSWVHVLKKAPSILQYMPAIKKNLNSNNIIKSALFCRIFLLKVKILKSLGTGTNFREALMYFY